MTPSLASELTLLAATTPMPAGALHRFMALAVQIRRVEAALDEMVEDSRGAHVAALSAGNVVFVDFVGMKG